jgi:hypothetical protein
VVAEENRACRSDLPKHGFGIGHRKAQVLCSQRRRGSTCFIEVANDKAVSVVAHRLLGDRSSRKCRELPFERGIDCIRLRARKHDGKRVCSLVVLGLRQEVSGDDLRICAVISDDENLARSGDRIDIDDTKDQSFRAGDVDVARAHDLIDAGNRLGAIRDGRDGLRSPRINHLGHPSDLRRSQDLRRWVRRNQDDPLDARNRRRNRGH